MCLFSPLWGTTIGLIFSQVRVHRQLPRAATDMCEAQLMLEVMFCRRRCSMIAEMCWVHNQRLRHVRDIANFRRAQPTFNLHVLDALLGEKMTVPIHMSLDALLGEKITVPIHMFVDSNQWRYT